MSQSDVSKAEAADQRSEQTRSFVRQVRAATRRKYTPEEKIRIVLGLPPRGYSERPMPAGGYQTPLLLRLDQGVHGGPAGSGCPVTRCGDATRQEIQDLKRENGELKQLVAELSFEAYRLKKTAIPMPQTGVGTNG